MSHPENTTFKNYVHQWWKAAFAPAWDAFGWVAVVVGLVLWGWHKYWPGNFEWSARAIGISPEAAMSDLVWVIPLSLGLLILMYRLVRAPYEIHQGMEKRSCDLVAQMERERIDHKNAMQGLQVKNRGLSLKISRVDFLKGPDDITLIAWVESLVNGNTVPASVAVKILVPIRIGNSVTTVTFSASAMSRQIPDMTTPATLLMPLTMLGAKQGVGPGYWLFMFTHAYLTGFLSPYPQATMDEMSMRVMESEIVFELLDVANETDPQRFDAPGTFVKRHQRNVRERASAKEQNAIPEE